MQGRSSEYGLLLIFSLFFQIVLYSYLLVWYTIHSGMVASDFPCMPQKTKSYIEGHIEKTILSYYICKKEQTGF